MKIKVKLKKEKYLVLINGYPIDSFDMRYEAIACKEQLEILGDEMIKEILESRNREN